MIWPTNDISIINQVVLEDEGGFVNNPADSGGPTNFGITQSDYAQFKGHAVSVDDIRNMPKADAVSIYLDRYIARPGFDQIKDLTVRTALVDMGVLMGAKRAIRAAQQALRLPIDGNLGPASIAAINAASAAASTFSAPRRACRLAAHWPTRALSTSTIFPGSRRTRFKTSIDAENLSGCTPSRTCCMKFVPADTTASTMASSRSTRYRRKSNLR